MKVRIHCSLVPLIVRLAAVAAIAGTIWWASRDRIDPPRIAIPAPEGPVRAIAFSPDGRHLVAASSRVLTVWDRTTWQPARSLNVATDVILSVAYSLDGGRLAVGGRDGHLGVWDTGRWEPCLMLQEGDADRVDLPGAWSVGAVCFSPDGRTVVAGHCRWLSPHLEPGEIRLWDTTDGKQKPVLRGHPAGVVAVAFSPDGALLGSVDGAGGVKLWNPVTGEHRRDLPRRPWDSALALAFAPSGGAVIYGGQWCEEHDVASVWDAASGTDRRLPGSPFNGRTTYVLCLALSPDGRTLATGELPKDGSGYRVRLWDVATGRPAGVIRCARRVNALTFSPDGAELAAGCGEEVGEVCIWDVPPKPGTAE